MNYKELKKQIKVNIAPLYLFYGEEIFLRDYSTDLLFKKVIDPDFQDFNYLVMNDSNLSLLTCRDAFEAYPVMSDKKLILIKESGIFSSKVTDKDKDGWVELLTDIPDFMCVVIVESSIDKRNKIYKSIEKKAAICEFAYMDKPDLKSTITKKLQDAGKKMSDKDIDFLLELCGPDLTNLKLQLEKLIAFSGTKQQIAKADIDAVITPPLSTKVYDISEAVASRNKDAALKLLSDLKKTGESAVRIITIMASYYQDLYRACVLSGENMSYQEMLIAMKLPPNRKFVADRLFKKAKSVNAEDVRNCLSECVKLENDIKNGFASDWPALELFVLKILCGDT
ncbi:MAG: DNA polymerase III subunit delta [Bacillota bacterium]|nr:DNA polymerase III subunit delta [Bacillota bacterium]